MQRQRTASACDAPWSAGELPADGRQQEQLFRLDKHVSVCAIQSGRAMISAHVHSDERLPQQEREATSIKSLMATPLERDGRVIGTLTVYDHVAADQFYAGRFEDEDLQSFIQFTNTVEQAVLHAQQRALSRQQRSLDEETGLPNAGYLRKRLQEELARAGGRAGALAVALCQIENLAAIQRDGGEALAHRVVVETGRALREHLREFDVLARFERNEFAIVLPDPGIGADERVYALARSVGDTLAKDESLTAGGRIALSLGYAVYPLDGEDRDALFSRAREPRIRLA